MNERNIPSVLSHAETDMKVSTIEKHGKYYEHASLPGKVIRWEEYTYNDHQAIPVFKEFLQDLTSRHHIPVVKTDFVISERPDQKKSNRYGATATTVDVISISEKINDAVASGEILGNDTVLPEVLHEFDLLTQRIVAHLADVYKQGGVFCTELYQYRQYVYSPSASRGQRLILVDVEALGLYVEPPQYERVVGYAPVTLLESLADITNDMLVLENQSGVEFAAGSEVVDLTESIDSQGIISIEETKQRIVRAVDQKDPSVLDAIRGTEDKNYDDALFARSFMYDTAEGVYRALENGRFI